MFCFRFYFRENDSSIDYLMIIWWINFSQMIFITFISCENGFDFGNDQWGTKYQLISLHCISSNGWDGYAD